MTVAVTGGSGVVGRAVVRHLVAAGEDVLALARSGESADVLSSLGVKVVIGDLLDMDILGELVEGREKVFHIAGVNEMCSRERGLMWRSNVQGSVAVLEASIRAGVSRFIYTSSAVTIGEAKGAVGSETSPHRGHFLSEYERSKTVAERLVLDRTGEIEVVSVNPSSVQGPGRSTGTGEILLQVARGKLPALVDTTLSLVDIDDCARGHLLAAAKGRSGNRYILSGAVITVREAVRLLNRYLGRRQRPWFVRPEVVTAVAPLVEKVFNLTGRHAPLCAESARVLLHGHRYDATLSREELGMEYTGLDRTLARTLEWFREEGLLDAQT